MSDPAQPITGLRPGEVGENVFLCGDPARVDRISKGWSGVRQVCAVREFRIAVGERDGVQLAAASTGIGGPGTAILLEELAKIGARNFIRIGNRLDQGTRDRRTRGRIDRVVGIGRGTVGVETLGEVVVHQHRGTGSRRRRDTRAAETRRDVALDVAHLVVVL